MNKYKDSFETRSDSLEQGGKGIMTAVRNEDVSGSDTKAPHSKPYADLAKDSSAISPIRTLADDLEQSVKTSRVTLSGQALEKERGKKNVSSALRGPEANRRTRKHKKESLAKKKRMPKSFVFLFFTLIIFGTSLYLFTSRQGIGVGSITLPSLSSLFNNQEAVTEPLLLAPLLQADETKELILTPTMSRRDLRELLNQESKGVQTGALIALTLRESFEVEGGTEIGEATLSSFLDILNPSVHSVLSRKSSEYTLGVSGGGEARAFLVAKIDSYDEIFGAFLGWERAMPRELYGFFHNDASIATSDDSSSFSDTIVTGHDARVLTKAVQVMNENGDTIENEEDVLIYSILNEETLIITHSREELARIISRLQ